MDADGWGKLKGVFEEACESIDVLPNRYDLECVEPDAFHFVVTGSWADCERLGKALEAGASG